jgi:glycosyltransferase involved in cell wall biosynthesis
MYQYTKGSVSSVNVQPHNTSAAVIKDHNYGKVLGQRKKISVILNYFQKETTVFSCLKSLEKQNWDMCQPEDVEIILIDDGSPDTTWISQLPEKVIYLWQKKNRYGICRAKNTGAKIANGDYLVFLDPDIVVDANYFNAMLYQFQQYGDSLIQCGYIWDYHFVGCPDPRLEFGVWEKPNRLTNRFYQLAGGNMAISRILFDKSPGFDEDLIYGGVEDLLFGYHLSKLPATQIMFNKNMLSWHIQTPPSGAHADPGKTWDIVKKKWPEFHDAYINKGLR